MQRLHPDDLVGHVFEQDAGWKHVNLPAIAEKDTYERLTRGRLYRRRVGDLLHPERESKAELDRLKRDMGSMLFSSEALWVDEFVTELLAFPTSRHDDQFDALSQALDRVKREEVPVAASATYSVRY